MKRLALLALLPAFANAQTITFSAETTTGVEQVTPVLTWDTEPLADNCVATGDWSGPKGGAGTETLPAITTSATYNLACTWTDDSVLLTWTIPTENTDDSAYTDPDATIIYYGDQQGGPYGLTQEVPHDGDSVQITGLPAGTWYFVATARNQNGIESEPSNEAQKTVGTETETRSVGITVNPRPKQITGLAAE